MGVRLGLIFLAAGAARVHGHGPYMPGSETSGLSEMLREVFGGSKMRNFIHRFMRPLPEVQVGTAVSPVSKDADGVMEQTFISPPMTLLNGHVGNKWLPIDWPEGHIAVKAFNAEVVKAGPNGEVPEPTACCDGPNVASHQEVFMHHWTVNKWQLPTAIFNKIVADGGMQYSLNMRAQGITALLAGAGLNSGANGPCWDSNLHLFFGIGNEVRGRPLRGGYSYSFPDPYGIEFDSSAMRKAGQFMVLNTHLIDLRNVSDQRACEECKCSELGVKPWDSRVLGGLNCCHSSDFDGGKCTVPAEVPMTNQTYYIRYTMQWREFDAETTKPLEVITFDATDNNTKWGDFSFVPGGFKEPHAALYNDSSSVATVIEDGRSGDFLTYRACHIEYFVPPCSKGESCVHRITNSWTLPYPAEIVYLRNHFHSGGYQMTTTAGQYNCTGHATYEDGHLRDISTCTLGDDAANGETPLSEDNFRMERNNVVSIEAIYHQDELPHYGVMAMSFVYAYIPKEQGFLV